MNPTQETIEDVVLDIATDIDEELDKDELDGEPIPAQPCQAKKCECEGTYRADLLMDEVSTRLSIYLCYWHYEVARMRWEAGLCVPQVLYVWFLGKVKR